uniref:CST complex subunit STN1 n=1 Tax=Chenopodium quinoa TaxID=63459 RepID=A0A803LFN7_CHEQI
MSNHSNKKPANYEPSINPNSLNNINVKLLAFDLNSLTQSHSLSSSSSRDSIVFYRKGIPISRVEVFGVVVTRDLKPDKFLRFSIDDGTGCVQCILWLNQMTSSYFSRRCPSDITVDDVVVERDPNYQILHWLDCVKLARKRYDVLSYKK